MANTVIALNIYTKSKYQNMTLRVLWNDKTVFKQCNLTNDSNMNVQVVVNTSNPARGYYLVFTGSNIVYDADTRYITLAHVGDNAYDSNALPSYLDLKDTYQMKLSKSTYGGEPCYISDFMPSYDSSGYPPLGYTLCLYGDFNATDDSLLNLLKASETPKPTTTEIDITATHSTVSPSAVNNTGTTEITATAENGYYFSTVPTLTYYDPFGESVISNFTLSSDSTTATYTFNASNADLTQPIKVSSTAIEKAPEPTEFNFDTSNVVNSTVNPTSFTIGDTVSITVKADSGYDFSSVNPYIEYYDLGYSRTSLNFNLNDAKTEGSITFDSSIAITDDSATYPIKIYALANVVASLATLYTPYIVSENDLSTIAQHRFGDSGLSNYINDIYMLPIVLDDSNKQALYLYNTKLLDSVGVIKERLLTYTMGTFELPRQYNNANDYNNDYYITLPYYGVYELDKTKLMDCEITLNALVDTIQGTCTYLFIRDETVIDSLQTDIKIGLPYLTANEARISNFTSVERFEIEPKIKCYCHGIPDADTTTNYNAKISDMSGYFEGAMIYIKVSEHYKEMINNELSKGVYLNGLH